MRKIKFSSRWNARKGSPICKLDLQSFTTIRLENTTKYQAGGLYEVELVGKNGDAIKHYGTAKIIQMTPFFLRDITEGMAQIDTGYSKSQCKDIIQKMYGSKNIDFSSKRLVFILLTYVETDLYN